MTTPDPVPLADVDLADIDRFLTGEQWAQFDTLRREAPVHWNPEAAPNHGFWSITRYADIWAVDRDSETFTSSKFVNIEEVEDELQEIRRSLLETDGPRHASLRALMQREFSPRALRGYEGFLRELTKQTVDKALEHGEFDFVSEVSADFPIQVLARMLDVPASDTGQLIAWGDEFEVPCRPARQRPIQAPAVPVSDGPGRVGLRRCSQGRAQGQGRDRPHLDPRQPDALRWDSGVGQRLPPVLHAPGHRRERDDAAYHQSLHARAHRQPGPAADPPGAPRAHPSRGRGDAAVGLSGLLLPPDGDARRRDAWSDDPRGRQGRHVVRVGQPRRGGLRGPLPLRRHSDQRRPHDVRQGIAAPVSGEQPGPDGDPTDVPGVAAAHQDHRARGRRPATATVPDDTHLRNTEPGPSPMVGGPVSVGVCRARGRSAPRGWLTCPGRPCPCTATRRSS